MPKKRRSPSVLGIFFLPLVALAILLIVLLLAGVWSIAGQAEALFGPPVSGLTPEQRLFLSAVLVLRAESLSRPTHPGAPLQTFAIQQGESLPSIANRLQQAGLISDPAAFRFYLQYSGLDRGIQAGEHSLSAGMSPVEIAQAIQTAPPGQAVLTILAGWRIEEIAEALPHSGLDIEPGEFLHAAQITPQGYSFSTDFPANSVEGFLFPGVYELERNTTASQLIALLLSHFEANLTPEMRFGFSAQGLSLYEAVTLASIIEREAVLDEEMPLIASVFLNRLRTGARLAADPTVQYALGYNPVQGSWWTNPLSLTDLEIASPYNTYLHPGLPPGPICNPGLTALEATASPAQTSYYYFRAACDGSGQHLFAETYQEHLENACP